MNKANCFNLGYIAKLHGFKGEVSLFLDVTNPEEYRSLDAIFIEINGFLTPFFIERITLKNKGFALIKLEGVNSDLEAKAILRKEVFLPIEVLPELSGTSFYDHEVIGFKVIDSAYGEVGELKQIIDYKVNPLIQIFKGEKEVLIPLLKDAILKVDRTKKELHIQSPEGLIELYLE
jgi:16S rRNA processing protein RimM